MRLDRVAKGFIQSGLENLKGCKDCTASLGNLFQGSIVLTIKKLFPVSSQNLCWFNYHKKHVSVAGNTFSHAGPDISGALNASSF